MSYKSELGPPGQCTSLTRVPAPQQRMLECMQAGDDDILRRMLRGYTHTRYREIVNNIRRYMPDASVSGDAIVGFPGETEEQFQRTVALVREVGFDRVNTAAYSPRPNTPAAEWEDQVADLVKADRLNRLNAVVNEVAEERAQRFTGVCCTNTECVGCMSCFSVQRDSSSQPEIISPGLDDCAVSVLRHFGVQGMLRAVHAGVLGSHVQASEEVFDPVTSACWACYKNRGVLRVLGVLRVRGVLGVLRVLGVTRVRGDHI